MIKNDLNIGFARVSDEYFVAHIDDGN